MSMHIPFLKTAVVAIEFRFYNRENKSAKLRVFF